MEALWRRERSCPRHVAEDAQRSLDVARTQALGGLGLDKVTAQAAIRSARPVIEDDEVRDMRVLIEPRADLACTAHVLCLVFCRVGEFECNALLRSLADDSCGIDPMAMEDVGDIFVEVALRKRHAQAQR